MTPHAEHNRTDPRVYGNGSSAVTPIEGAARAGYIDAGERRSFSPEYAANTGQWQRNYEAGRQWATAIRAIGEELPDWPENAKTPGAILSLLSTIRQRTGSGTRPEDFQSRPHDTNAPVRAVVPTLRRGRIVERITK